jgi:hypothetical protein
MSVGEWGLHMLVQQVLPQQPFGVQVKPFNEYPGTVDMLLPLPGKSLVVQHDGSSHDVWNPMPRLEEEGKVQQVIDAQMDALCVKEKFAVVRLYYGDAHVHKQLLQYAVRNIRSITLLHSRCITNCTPCCYCAPVAEALQACACRPLSQA